MFMDSTRKQAYRCAQHKLKIVHKKESGNTKVSIL